MARLYVDRLSINSEAAEMLTSLLKLHGKPLSNDKFHDLILEAGYLPDYKEYGSDLASIRIVLHNTPVKQFGKKALMKLLTYLR